MVDMMVVGQFVGPTGMTAVSMGTQITTILLAMINGLANGGSIVSAQLSGRGERERIPRVIGTLLLFFATVAVVLSVGVAIFARPLLLLVNTPEVAMDQAIDYLLICLIGTIFVYSYNCMAATLRGTGNSKAPLVIVIITVALNAVLDLLFIAAFSMGAAGAALATILCQFASMVMIAVYTKKKAKLFDFKLSSFRIEKKYLAAAVKIGLPQSIQFFFASSANLFLSSLVNLFGVTAAAAAGAVAKVHSIATLTTQGVMSGLITLTAQNLAVDQPKRVVRGLLSGILFSFSMSFVIFFICMVFPGFVFGIFTPEAEVAIMGVGYLRWICLAMLLESFMFTIFGTITGSGYTPVTMCCGIMSAFVIRYSTAWIFVHVLELGFSGIGLSFAIGPVISTSICVIFLLSGRWKKQRVKVS